MACEAAQRERKRRKPNPAAAAARKLLVGDEVEVLSSDEGLGGSWHQAVVISCSENSRTVKYTDFLNDGGSQLVEDIVVSDAIEGKLSAPTEFTRGNIRPLHPHLPLRASDVSYGLCVDALVEGSHWEGVIADHMEGSKERKVLFPDEGDERKMVVDQLRLTQDWDEVTGEWKPRGSWEFLRVLRSHEERDGLPISIRQIWYDLRSGPSFLADVKMWMCGTEAYWNRSVSALIRELRSLCDNRPVHEVGQLEYSQSQAEASTSATFGKEKLQSIGLNKLDSMAAVLSQAMSEFISYYRNNDRKSALAKRNVAKHHLKSLGWRFVEDKPKNKYYVSPNGKRFPSFIGACEAWLAQKGITDPQENVTHNLDRNNVTCKNSCHESTGMDLVLRDSEANHSLSMKASTDWRPVELGAEYSAETVSLLSKHQEDGTTLLSRLNRGRSIDKTLRIKLKKHLLALGWSIKSRKDTIMRFRYDSPDGKTYYSFYKVCCSLIDGCVQGSRKYRIEDEHDRNGYLDQNRDEMHTAKSRDISILGELTPEHRSDAITDYIDYMRANVQYCRMSKQKELGERLRSNAKKHLKSAGWKFWLKKRYNRQEMWYRAPYGRSYNSLLAACKAYPKEGYRENNNVSPEITSNDCSDGSMPSCKSIGNGGLGDSSGRQNQLVLVADRCDDTPTLSTHLSGCRQSKKRKALPVHVSQARVLRSSTREGHILTLSSGQRRAKTVLSLLMDKNIVLPRDKLTYKPTSDGPRMKEGSITRDGIKCMCCNEIFTLVNFEVHAGSSTRRPSAHIFLKDGRSLSQCLVQLMGGNKPKGSLHVRLKGENSDLESDGICSICHDGGEILLCDHCPSTFHHACLGLEVTPGGSWFCPSCRCSICDSSDYDPDANKFTEKTIMYCDQCEREYHVGCIRENRCQQLSCCPEGCWFCSRECSKIFQHLQKLIGKSIPTSVEGLSFTLLRFTRENAIGHDDYDDETMAEQHGKLCVVLDVLHECFVTIIEPRTQSDLVADIVFNRESELSRLNFRGFYTILLEKGEELISVGTFRVYGKKIAELPLVGTRFPYRRQGMCHLLMNELEKLLSKLGVERLLLPAVPQLLETWTGSFGFTVMSKSDRLELAENTILSFQGTTMCQKVINKGCKVPDQLKRFNDQLERSSSCHERENCDSQESTSEVVENTEPVLLLEMHSNIGEEGIYPSDVANSLSRSCSADLLLGTVEDKSEQPQVSVDADQCKDNYVLTEAAPVAANKVVEFEYKFTGKCYERIRKSSCGRNAWLRASKAIKNISSLIKRPSV